MEPGEYPKDALDFGPDDLVHVQHPVSSRTELKCFTPDGLDQMKKRQLAHLKGKVEAEIKEWKAYKEERERAAYALTPGNFGDDIAEAQAELARDFIKTLEDLKEYL